MLQVLSVQPENYEGAIRLTAWLDGRVRNLGGEHLQAVMEGESGLLVMKTRRAGILLALASGGSPCDTTAEPGRIVQSYAIEAKTGRRPSSIDAWRHTPPGKAGIRLAPVRAKSRWPDYGPFRQD
jgi:hypothetical protein